MALRVPQSVCRLSQAASSPPLTLCLYSGWSQRDIKEVAGIKGGPSHEAASYSGSPPGPAGEHGRLTANIYMVSATWGAEAPLSSLSCGQKEVMQMHAVQQAGASAGMKVAARSEATVR